MDLARGTQHTRRTAKAFADLGVVKGDHVLSWQPNGPDAVLTWFGLNYLGAVYVPLNTATRAVSLSIRFESQTLASSSATPTLRRDQRRRHRIAH